MSRPRVVVIDSGQGGIFLAEQLSLRFPNIEFLTETDPENVPYGEKTPDELKTLGMALLRRALRNRPHLIIVACHTLCSWCFEDLQLRSPVPLLSVNVAILESLLALPQNTSVCLLGTTNTIQSEWFQNHLERLRPDLQTRFQACPGLATAIEKADTPKTAALLDEFLPTESVQALGLICTHYPVVKAEITQRFAGKIIDSEERITKELRTFSAAFLG